MKLFSFVDYINLDYCENEIQSQSQFPYVFQKSKYINWGEGVVNGPFDILYEIISNTASCGTNQVNG